MKRRQLIMTLGTVAGGSAVLGTGAFSSVSAERHVSVNVADDDDAYLAIDPNSQFVRSTTSSGPVEFYIPGLTTRANMGGPKGKGIAPNSNYIFDSLITVQNRGEDPIEVFSNVPALPSEFERLSLVDSDREGLLDTESNATELTSGEEFSAGLLIETGTVSTDGFGDYDLSLEINANPVRE